MGSRDINKKRMQDLHRKWVIYREKIYTKRECRTYIEKKHIQNGNIYRENIYRNGINIKQRDIQKSEKWSKNIPGKWEHT